MPGSAFDGQTYCLMTDKSGNLYAAGDFTNGGGERPVRKWDGKTWTTLGSTGAKSEIDAMCMDSKENIYIGGVFVDPVNKVNYVAKWDGKTWTTLKGSSVQQWYRGINTLCVDKKDNVYAAGFFKFATFCYVAKWDGTNWNQLGTLKANGAIQSICADTAGNIYAAGAFTNSAGKQYVAKWDGTNWSELGNLAANGKIESICLDSKNNLYATGYFTDSVTHSVYVAKWDGTSWTNITKDSLSGILGIVEADSLDNIYFGGEVFDKDSGCYIGKWSGNSWSSIGNTAMVKGLNAVLSMAFTGNGDIYAGGFLKDTSGKYYIAMANSNVTGISGTASPAIRLELYPNPANDRIYFRNENIATISHLEITDISGKVVRYENINGKENSMDIASLPTGVYIVKLQSPKGIYIGKFVKE